MVMQVLPIARDVLQNEHIDGSNSTVASVVGMSLGLFWANRLHAISVEGAFTQLRLGAVT